MERPPESLKSFANYLAQIVPSEKGGKIAWLQWLTVLFGAPPNQAPNRPGPSVMGRSLSDEPANPNRIGIWERKSEAGNSYFARRLDLSDQWRFWANVGRIDPKGAKRRIVLLGESVARGYLYDPQFTPSMALEMILRPHFCQSGIEVIDLARTSLGIEELMELARSAIMLEPDAVIIFSGNNWGFFYPSGLDLQCVVAALRERGIAGLKQYAEDSLAMDIKRVVKAISSLYEDKNVPLVWIIPEFNLGDWRDPAANAPHLPNGANRQWIELWEDALNALRSENISAASESAKKMVELDQSVSSTGLYILAECSRRLGDRDAARRYMEMARDAQIWDVSRLVSPRPYSIMQETLRNEVGRYKSCLVDLPQLFNDYLKGELPDRRLFMDYCHLTSEGIRITMAAAAASLLRLIKGMEVSWSALADERIAPTREVEGEAAFLAAIHNAHWWQSEDLVDYYCLRSLQAAPKIAQALIQFIDLQTRRAPMLMCQSAEQIAWVGSPLVQHYLLYINHQRLDKPLLEAVSQSLKKHGMDIRGRLNQLRREEHSVTHRKINLLDLYYCTSSQQPQEVMWVMPGAGRNRFGRRSDYYKAYWKESRFAFVGETNCLVRLCLTCRLPSPGLSEGFISLWLNGEPVAEILIDREWETWEIDVARERAIDGINEIVIRWPLPQFLGEAALEAVANGLLVSDKAFPEFFPVFGEIHSFTASAVAV